MAFEEVEERHALEEYGSGHKLTMEKKTPEKEESGGGAASEDQTAQIVLFHPE